MTLPTTKFKLAVLEGVEMLNFRHGDNMYTYCSECINSAVVPVATEVLGCTIGDDPEVRDFSDKVDAEEVDPDVMKCPGFSALISSTPGVGEPRRAALVRESDHSQEAGIMKDVPAEVHPHTSKEWEEILDSALEDLRSSDPRSTALVEHAIDVIRKHDHLSQGEPEQEYDFFGQLEEHPSGGITSPKPTTGQVVASLVEAEKDLFRFLKSAGLNEEKDLSQRRILVSKALAVWHNGLLDDVSASMIDKILAEYEERGDVL